MSDMKQVKVDNWGIYFLQRLKHFFNRTDYCDLTLQFQDNAQLKVHRLVLNVCTEYFELLERTCEMYEDCLVMPDDLQADVVVPIVNFMYTGQLEFKKDSLDKLYQTSQVMNMPVLTKLLEAHRGHHSKSTLSQSYGGMKKLKSMDAIKTTRFTHSTSTPSSSGKRSYNKAFEVNKTFGKPKVESRSKPMQNIIEITKNRSSTPVKSVPKDKKNITLGNNGQPLCPPSPVPIETDLFAMKSTLSEPRPTRYELPEELDTDNIFENSFSNISYTSKPLMVHPETTKQYSSKKNSLYSEASTSKKLIRGPSTVDIVECKKIAKNDFYDDAIQNDDEIFQPAYISVRDESNRDPSQLFDQIIDNDSPKVTIEGKDKTTGNLDHAKIISEVLKKYPHLVKGNKNIKLKITNTTNKIKKTRPSTPQVDEKIDIKSKSDINFTYETEVLDSKKAAKLIAMGAENIKGPWICLICGTPGKALNFTSYYNFRRHLIEIHNEKPVSTICEYCGLRSYKRNYLLHHIYTKHGVPPPPQYHFPKCNICDYIALTEGFLVKHKLSHSDTRPIRCLVCSCAFNSPTQLALHVQKTGHKTNPNKKENLQCVYCMKVFLRESNFYVHLKTNHKEAAIRDGRLIEDSDEDTMKSNIKYDHQILENELEDTDTQYTISHIVDGATNTPKKARMASNIKHKILNPGFSSSAISTLKQEEVTNTNTELLQKVDTPSVEDNEGNIIIIDGTEYIMKYNQLIPKKYTSKHCQDYIIQEIMEPEAESKLQTLETKFTPSTSAEFTNAETNIQQPKMIIKKSQTNQPIQIVVSNEEEYKALMASNHSIIFEDSLATQSPMENPGLDLQNNQNNEMMIIQEQYPLNVSETVSTDSSKYVVVYSHAVGHGDPNKQYQIITPQEIGAEYVQTTEVIAENYENVTPNAVLNTHVIEQSWPEENADGHATVEIIPKNKNIEVPQNVEKSENVTNNTIVSLPEVQLSCKVPDETPLEQLETDVIQVSTTTTVNVTDQVIIEDNQNNTENIPEPMDVDVALAISHVEVAPEVNTEGESNITLESQCAKEEIIEKPTEEQLLNVKSENANVKEHIVLDNEETIEENKSEEINNSVTRDVPDENNTVVVNDVSEIITVNSDAITIVHTDQIQNITSEWSEDEYETVLENSTAEKTSSETLPTDEPEMEESIENIQQEMQKQLACTNAETVVNDSVNTQEVHLSAVDESNDNEQHLSATGNEEAAQKKISSLLNDWEDNDSQEENGTQEDNVSHTEKAENEPPIESVDTDKGEESRLEVSESDKTEPKKDDNIKSLVSDWDDDDEEEVKD